MKAMRISLKRRGGTRAILVVAGLLVGGLTSATVVAPWVDAATGPRPTVELSPGTRITSMLPMHLEETGPAAWVVTTARPVFNGLAVTRDVLVVVRNQIRHRWMVVFDAAKAYGASAKVNESVIENLALLPDSYTDVGPLRISAFTATPGATDLELSELVTPGANEFLNVGIVHLSGERATLEYLGSFLDGLSARVVGTSPHQRVELRLGWDTASDPVCCVARTYTQTLAGRAGGIAVVADTRSWLGVTAWVAASGASSASPVVLSVVPGSPAAGVLRPGDQLVSVVGASAPSNIIGAAVIDQIAVRQPGDRIGLVVRRDGVERTVFVTLSSYESRAKVAYAPDAADFGFLGLEAVNLSKPLRSSLHVKGTGVEVSAVAPGSPAEVAGLGTGDVIERVGANRIADTSRLSQVLWSQSSGLQVVYLTPGGRRHLAHLPLPTVGGSWSFEAEITQV